MGKTAKVTGGLTGLFTLGGLWGGNLAWCLGLWVGALWGLVNGWCMSQVVRRAVQGNRGWRGAAGWIVLKFVGLYSLLAWLLVGVRVSPAGWFTGFTLSLVGLGVPLALTGPRLYEPKGSECRRPGGSALTEQAKGLRETGYSR
jgi:hypothetical protein